MKKTLAVLMTFLLFSFSVYADQLETDIYNELQLEKAEELIPSEVENSGISFSVKNTPSENGMNVNMLFKTIIRHMLAGLVDEIEFILTIIAILVFASIIGTFVENGNTSIRSGVNIALSAVVATVLITHIENAFVDSQAHVSEITEFMTGLLPFLGSLSLIGGEFTASIVQKTVLLTVINLLQNVINAVVIPVCEMIVALSVAGYVSGISLGSVSELISGIATKTITLSCGIMCAILYFQNTVSSVTDSLTLRSVKLVAGNFIPIVGAFVSEASGTLISGVKLVKSTFGIFAICILLYMSIGPIISFVAIKLSMRFSGIVAKLLGCDREAKVFGEISSVYNILSALMTASACFFIFAVTIFIQSGGK